MTIQPNTPIDLVAFSGNAHRPSRSRALTEVISRRIGERVDARIRQYDIVDASPGLGAALSREELSPEALAIVEAVENADVLVVSSPVYKGSYTGLFKHFFDFVDPTALIGKPVVLAATGGGPRHSLVVEHQLRPLFGFFSALTIPTSVYAEDKSFEDFRQVDPGILARIDLAASQTAVLVAAQRQNRIPRPEETPEDPESGATTDRIDNSEVND
ncbi:FMN reductase [Paradevosia shaoguanensis]|uniref:FMN reductase n=1 Tax=Paradevosia shaoguanensis TaxID=1335043 RepID=UPI003C785726